jgi:hypothetical protein
VIARALACAAAMALVATAAACADDRIVLAHLAADGGNPGGGDDGGSPGGSGAPCKSIDDCPHGSFCNKQACGDPTGSCAVIPTNCGGDHDLVCGCDGVTYFNDCLRQQRRVESKIDGECPIDGPIPVAQCYPGTPCDGDALCAELYFGGPDCPPGVGGKCWVLPNDCPPAPPQVTRFNVCGASPDQCVDSCLAIKSGQPYRPARQGCVPPPPP